ncbi:ribonucleoprotein [Candidatus Bathyarchaeota archaeon]|nr:ribonucleoprotein [Candidatus Bathyarchaeota archaeon]
MSSGVKPMNVLAKLRNSRVKIRLKNNAEYSGVIVSCDTYMNLLLDDAEEYRDGEPKVNYGRIFIRGSNILYISFEA